MAFRMCGGHMRHLTAMCLRMVCDVVVWARLLTVAGKYLPNPG